jgi:AmmeMemoRadiSam system protein A
MSEAPDLTDADKRCLLELARAALTVAVTGAGPAVTVNADPASLPEALRQPGCCFVTLMRAGELRGCVGGLLPELPLYLEVGRRAAQAALYDERFLPVQPAELDDLELEVSVLTPPTPLAYAGPDDLLRQLRPGVDGVVLSDGRRRATFLPQVWAKLPAPEQFLGRLCEKLGTRPDAWRAGRLQVAVYQVIEFADEPVSRPED